MPGSDSGPPPLQILTGVIFLKNTFALIRSPGIASTYSASWLPDCKRWKFQTGYISNNISIPNINTKDRRRSWHKDANSIFEHPRSPMKIPLRLVMRRKNGLSSDDCQKRLVSAVAAASFIVYLISSLMVTAFQLSETWTSLAKGSNRTSLSKWISKMAAEMKKEGVLLLFIMFFSRFFKITKVCIVKGKIQKYTATAATATRAPTNYTLS
ncbi:hypothetical protein EDC94DRAFT_584403 [Helicostylum pulchrum]|nr:hypothetical protein EDC94DRAFT_584403 [Helicostylum pulchrum]